MALICVTTRYDHIELKFGGRNFLTNYQPANIDDVSIIYDTMKIFLQSYVRMTS